MSLTPGFLGEEVDQIEAEKTLRLALDSGIILLNTADFYTSQVTGETSMNLKFIGVLFSPLLSFESHFYWGPSHASRVSKVSGQYSVSLVTPLALIGASCLLSSQPNFAGISMTLAQFYIFQPCVKYSCLVKVHTRSDCIFGDRSEEGMLRLHVLSAAEIPLWQTKDVDLRLCTSSDILQTLKASIYELTKRLVYPVLLLYASQWILKLLQGRFSRTIHVRELSSPWKLDPGWKEVLHHLTCLQMLWSKHPSCN